MKRIGLMGCGTVADYGHIPTILKTAGLELFALYDPDAGRLEAARKKFGIAHAFTQVEPFMACGIEAVTLTSPAPCHLQNIRDAARHGKHILCEKPLATDVDQCRQAQQAADAAGVMLLTAFDYRFSPVAKTIRRIIAEGGIGKARSLRLIYIWNAHGKFSQDADGGRVVNDRRQGRMLEGGPMVDCGVHQIDLARWWLRSQVVRFSAAGAWVDDYEAPDHVYLHMDHACGAHTTVEISYSYCHTALEPISHFSYEIIGTEGILRYAWPQTFELRNAKGTQTLPFACEKNFAGMYEEFGRALETGAPGDMPTAEDGLEAVRISRQATEALVRDRCK